MLQSKASCATAETWHEFCEHNKMLLSSCVHVVRFDSMHGDVRYVGRRKLQHKQFTMYLAFSKGYHSRQNLQQYTVEMGISSNRARIRIIHHRAKARGGPHQTDYGHLTCIPGSLSDGSPVAHSLKGRSRRQPDVTSGHSCTPLVR